MEKKLLINTMMFEPFKESLNESLSGTSNTFTVKGILQKAEEENQNNRVYPFPVLSKVADIYIKNFVNERRALGELDHPSCFDERAEILTVDGWKFIKDIQDTEKVYTLNTDTNKIEVQQINKKINDPYTGKMISIKGKNIDVLVTPTHRFLVNDRNGKKVFITAEDLLNLSKSVKATHLSIPKTGLWDGTDFGETFEIPAVDSYGGSNDNKIKQSTPLKLETKAFFSFLGFYLAEGCVSDKTYGYKISIFQNSGEKSDLFRTLLKELSSELTWKESINDNNCISFSTTDARLWTYLNKLGDKYTKYIPQDIKNANPALLEELFDWFLKGDGTVVDDRGYVVSSAFSVSKRLVEDLQEVLFKIGGSGRIKIQISPKDYEFAEHIIKVENKKPLYRLYVNKSENIHLDFRFIEIKEIDYTGNVYCVSVPNSTFYCRSNGKCLWTGNSEVVNLKNVSHNLVEMHWEGKNLVGTIEILPTPSGNILKELFKSNIRLGISSRGVGSIKKLSEGIDQVQDDYTLIAFDFVSNPSTRGAFMFPTSSDTIKECVNTPVKNPETNKWETTEEIILNILNEIP